MSGVHVDRLRFAYPGGDDSLRGISFTVGAGERVAILGANGAGKSTLLLHLNGLLLPDQGEVTVAGIPVEEATLRDVRRRVGMVFQDPDDQLFLPTLLEDVAFGPLNDGEPPDRAEAATREILRELGLDHAAGRAAHHLSGGEKRLASLATVLVARPEILVLDEPTAGLDARSRHRLVELLRRRSGTLIIATHDLEVAGALCHRALVLADGRLIASDDLAILLADSDLLRAHGLQQPLAPFEPRGVHERAQ